jgi:hypothetical protein
MLAVGQREEDPERAWLEAMSVREKLAALEPSAADDPLLVEDIGRFREKLETQLSKLTRDMGDEMLAPLYSWIDLLAQRAGLEGNVETARTRVAEARAARGIEPGPSPSAEAEAASALGQAEAQLAWWKSETPPPPPPGALVAWTQVEGGSLRADLPTDPRTVAARARAAQSLVTRAGTRALGDVWYAGSKLELLLGPFLGAIAILCVLYARASAWRSRTWNEMAAAAVGLFVVAASASLASRRRAAGERRAGVSWVWHHRFFSEQASALELEVGWLRALVAALRAKRAFDAHKGEGGQLEELARWRPDLEPFVAEAVRRRVARAP